MYTSLAAGTHNWSSQRVV